MVKEIRMVTAIGRSTMKIVTRAAGAEAKKGKPSLRMVVLVSNQLFFRTPWIILVSTRLTSR